MSFRYLLDTNILSEPAKPIPNENVLRQLNIHQLEIVTASVVIHELIYGCLRLPESRRRDALWNCDISLIGHSLGAHVSIDVALALQNRNLGNVKSIILLDPAVDMPTGYTVKNLSSISELTFIRAFYTSNFGSSSLSASANESYNVKFLSGRINPIAAHGEAMTLLANSFQGDSSSKRNCIAEQFTKLDQPFPSIPQNTKRERPADGTKPPVDLYVTYDSNKWLYPKQIVSRGLDVNPEKGNCKLESDSTRTFDFIQDTL